MHLSHRSHSVRSSRDAADRKTPIKMIGPSDDVLRRPAKRSATRPVSGLAASQPPENLPPTSHLSRSRAVGMFAIVCRQVNGAFTNIGLRSARWWFWWAPTPAATFPVRDTNYGVFALIDDMPRMLECQ